MYSNSPTPLQIEMPFTSEMLEKANQFIKRYPEGNQKSAILPIMHLFQKHYGWISLDAQNQIASFLHVKPIEVYEVATFYTFFHLRPVGKYVLEVCRTGPCMIRGAEDICKYLEKTLGIKEGETTSDGLFTWRTVECLGACGYAPMMQVGEYYHEFLTPEKLDSLIHNWRESIKTSSANN